MKIFLDSSEARKVKYSAKLEFVDGVSTDPSMIATANKNIGDLIKEICEIVDGRVSAEVFGVKSEEVIEQEKKLAQIDKRVVVKMGIRALTHNLSRFVANRNISVNYLSPGIIATDFTKDTLSEDKKNSFKDDVNEKICKI